MKPTFRGFDIFSRSKKACILNFWVEFSIRWMVIWQIFIAISNKWLVCKILEVFHICLVVLITLSIKEVPNNFVYFIARLDRLIYSMSTYFWYKALYTSNSFTSKWYCKTYMKFFFVKCKSETVQDNSQDIDSCFLWDLFFVGKKEK